MLKKSKIKQRKHHASSRARVRTTEIFFSEYIIRLTGYCWTLQKKHQEWESSLLCLVGLCSRCTSGKAVVVCRPWCLTTCEEVIQVSAWTVWRSNSVQSAESWKRAVPRGAMRLFASSPRPAQCVSGRNPIQFSPRSAKYKIWPHRSWLDNNWHFQKYLSKKLL